MTKLRRPLTPYRALSRIADLLGWDGCAEVVEKSESSVRKLSDPDAGREISLQDAIRLDAAFRRAGGDGAPLFEVYAARLDLDVTDTSPEGCLIMATGTAAREAGEAFEATLASLAANNPAARQRAIHETEESLAAMQKLLLQLRQGVPS